jgi:hypothetical protein
MARTATPWTDKSPLSAALRQGAFWVDVIEEFQRMGDPVPPHVYRMVANRRAELIAAVAAREGITVEQAAELLAGDYLFGLLTKHQNHQREAT